MESEHSGQDLLRAIAGPQNHAPGERQGHQGDRPRRHRRCRRAPTAQWGEALMARTDVRIVVKLRSTAGTGYTYVTRKNRRNDPDRLVLTKYDPVIRRHVPFREER